MRSDGILQFKTAAAPPAVSDRRAVPRVESKRFVVKFAVKADAIDEEERTFEGLASVWGKDLGDDVMHAGAFKKTIAEWKKGDEAIPLLNSHNHWDVLSAVGQLVDAKETKDGLWTKWEIIKGPDGDRVLDRIRPGANGRSPVGKMSIGFEPMKIDFEKDDSARFGQIRNLREVSLKEVSLVLFPMAPGASIDASSVKSFADDLSEVKVEEVDDETKAQLRKLASRIGNLLAGKKGASPEPQEPPVPKTEPKTPAAPAKAAAAPDSSSSSEAGGETGEGGEAGTGGAGTKAGEAPEGSYQYPEALATRISSVRDKVKGSTTQS